MSPLSSADTEATTEEQGQGEESPHDRERRAVLDALRSELGDAVVDAVLEAGDLWVRVRTDAWRKTGQVCRSLGFDYFDFLSGLDWMPATAPNPEEQGAEMGDVGDGDGDGDQVEADAGEAGAPAEAPQTDDGGWVTGVAGGDSRFQVFARLHSTSRKVGVTLKADLDEDEPRVDSWTSLYPGADWHERETWEMYGFDFVGHPNLTHLYLPAEFEGHPLRKDFPLLSREVKPWPGLVDVEPMPEEEEQAAGDAAAGEGGSA